MLRTIRTGLQRQFLLHARLPIVSRTEKGRLYQDLRKAATSTRLIVYPAQNKCDIALTFGFLSLTHTKIRYIRYVKRRKKLALVVMVTLDSSYVVSTADDGFTRSVLSASRLSKHFLFFPFFLKILFFKKRGF